MIINVFERGKICYKMVYYTLCLGLANRVGKLKNLLRRKTDFSERGFWRLGYTDQSS